MCVLYRHFFWLQILFTYNCLSLMNHLIVLNSILQSSLSECEYDYGLHKNVSYTYEGWAQLWYLKDNSLPYIQYTATSQTTGYVPVDCVLIETRRKYITRELFIEIYCLVLSPWISLLAFPSLHSFYVLIYYITAVVLNIFRVTTPCKLI